MGHEESRIAWHPAFVEAIQLELKEYRDSLEFIPEFQLTSEPLKIECVIVKKTKDAVIKKNIAAIFREANLIEYKSPDDYVSVADFNKVYAYAYLYSSFNKIPISNLTISFIESHYPRELLAYLSETRGFKVEENQAGIYTISGDALPIQFVDSRKLPVEENLWLKGLNKRLDPLEIIKISEEVRRLEKTARVQAYMDAIAKANYHAIEEAMSMSEPARSLDEVLERTGLAARWEARGIEKGIETVARNALAEGLSIESVSRITGFDVETLQVIRDK